MLQKYLNEIRLRTLKIPLLQLCNSYSLQAKRLLKEERLKQDYMAGEASQSKEQVV